MGDRILGKDYVVLKGTGQRDMYNGASALGDDFCHLGIIDPFKGSHTACDKPIENFMLTYSDVEVDCPECVAILTKPKKVTDA